MDQLNCFLPIIQTHLILLTPVELSVTLSLPLKHQIVFGLSLDLPCWHQGSIMVGEE